MKFKDLVQRLTLKEAGKEEVNVAQMSEVLRKLCEIQADFIVANKSGNITFALGSPIDLIRENAIHIFKERQKS